MITDHYTTEEIHNVMIDIITTNGQEIWSKRGTREMGGYFEPTHNLKVRVFEIAGFVEARHFVLVEDNASLRELAPIRIINPTKGSSIREAVTRHLTEWGETFVEAFRSENIID